MQHRDIDRLAAFEVLLPKQARDPGAALRPALAWLHGKRVGVYSLAEAAAQRFARVLSQMVKGVKVTVNSDHVGTEALRAMARNSDLLVVATRTAKHAATIAIEQARQPDAHVIYPTGKGSSSMLEALVAHLERFADVTKPQGLTA